MHPFYGRGFGYFNIILIIIGIILICVPPFILFPIIGIGCILAAILPRGIFRR